MDLFDYSDDDGDIVILGGEKYLRCPAISGKTVDIFRKRYDDDSITHEDIFYYVYGVLNSPVYCDRYQSDLSKMLPHIPFAPDFRGFMVGGRALGLVHLNYESIDMYRCDVVDTYMGVDDFERYSVKKMKFGCDKSIIIYNQYITISGVPLRAYEYKVNGRSAIEWVMCQYRYSQDKESGIIKDPNDWCRECGDAKYIFNLLLRVVNVSIMTLDIIESLPEDIGA